MYTNIKFSLADNVK